MSCLRVKLSAVDKNLEVTHSQEAVASSQPETVVDAKTELSTSVEKTLDALATGKDVVDVVNIGCLERFAKLFCFLTVKNVVNAVDLSGSVVEAMAKEVDLSGSVLSNVVAALQSHVPPVGNVLDLSGNLLNVLENVASVDLSGSVLQNLVTAVEAQKTAAVATVHEEAVYFVNKMISSSQKRR